MKNSTKRDSSKVKVADTVVQKTICGLAFLPSKKFRKRNRVYLGIQGWYADEMPDNVYIYDTIDNLLACGIPVSDAVVDRGAYFKTKPGKPKLTEVILPGTWLSPIVPIKVTKKVAGIFHADTQEYHRMTYQ